MKKSIFTYYRCAAHFSLFLRSGWLVFSVCSCACCLRSVLPISMITRALTAPKIVLDKLLLARPHRGKVWGGGSNPHRPRALLALVALRLLSPATPRQRFEFSSSFLGALPLRWGSCSRSGFSPLRFSRLHFGPPLCIRCRRSEFSRAWSARRRFSARVCRSARVLALIPQRCWFSHQLELRPYSVLALSARFFGLTSLAFRWWSKARSQRLLFSFSADFSKPVICFFALVLCLRSWSALDLLSPQARVASLVFLLFFADPVRWSSLGWCCKAWICCRWLEGSVHSSSSWFSFLSVGGNSRGRVFLVFLLSLEEAGISWVAG
jgi:hypothetical protein